MAVMYWSFIVRNTKFWSDKSDPDLMMMLTITAVILGSLSPTIGSYYLDVNMCSILYCYISIHTIVLLIALCQLLFHYFLTFAFLPKNSNFFLDFVCLRHHFIYSQDIIFLDILNCIYLEFKISIIRSEMRIKLVPENNF